MIADIAALEREPSVVGMVRFFQQFEAGNGDYVEKRQSVVGKLGVRALGERIEASQRAQRTDSRRGQ
jgi:hypothetical protein